jgi:predicted transcriptional regulator
MRAVVITAKISHELDVRLSQRAHLDDRSKSAIVRLALAKFLATEAV